MSDQPDVHDAAVAAMDRGWKVFPVRGKVPATKNGLHDASGDVSKVRGWWGLHEDRGIALATGEASGVWALDLDGEEGEAAIRSLQKEHGPLPTTVVSRTGGGGYHLLWRMPDDLEVRNSAGRVAPGVDVRGTGGYVVLPPSAHPSGERYEWTRPPEDTPVADAPDWLLDLVTQTSGNGRPAPAEPLPETIPAGQRNATLASLAGTMRRRGATPGAMRAALHEENRARCHPPLPEEEVDKIATSISRYDPAPADADRPPPEEEDWGDPETEELPAPVRALDAEAPPPPRFLVDDFLLEAEPAILAGDGGTFKTTVAIEISAAVAGGYSVFDSRDFEARQGPVLFVSEEDGLGVLLNRLEALVDGHGWDREQVFSNTYFLAHSGAKLDDPDWQDHLTRQVQATGAALVVFDPLRELVRDENSNDEARPVVSFWRRLIAETGTTVLVNHHATKKGDRRKMDRVRGASAWRDGARAVYFLDTSELGVRVECLKLNRAPPPPAFVVEAKIEADPENPASWTSARLAYVSEHVAEDQVAQAGVLDALTPVPGPTSTELRAHVSSQHDVSPKEVGEAIKVLEADGRIDYEPGARGAKNWYRCDPAYPPHAGSDEKTETRPPDDPAYAGYAGSEEEGGRTPADRSAADVPAVPYGDAGSTAPTAGGGTQPSTCPSCGSRIGPTADRCGACRAKELGWS